MPKGRGAATNPPNRFEPVSFDFAEWPETEERSAPKTQFFQDHSRTIITYNDSPDLGLTVMVNPYRGCEHGCIYCYGRPYHEYLGYSLGLDFETKIFVKENAPGLLRDELMKSKWQPQIIGMCGVTDPYQPVERQLQLTRRCLQVLVEFRNPVVLITKNVLVTRDIDILQQLARYQAVKVQLSITTLNSKLGQLMEPRTSQPQQRLEAVRRLKQAGIPVGVMIAPVVPALTDHELMPLVKAAVEAGADSVHYTMLRLPYQVKDLFADWIRTHFPQKADKVLNRLRAIRNGQLNDSRFKVRFLGEGEYADQINNMFHVACRRAGLDPAKSISLSTAQFRRPTAQLDLFEK